MSRSGGSLEAQEYRLRLKRHQGFDTAGEQVVKRPDDRR
jgi:hypothetical protein